MKANDTNVARYIYIYIGKRKRELQINASVTTPILVVGQISFSSLTFVI